MGNSNSVSINDFQNQLISSCLWSLRQDEIKELYYKNKKKRLLLYLFKTLLIIDLNFYFMEADCSSICFPKSIKIWIYYLMFKCSKKNYEFQEN